LAKKLRTGSPASPVQAILTEAEEIILFSELDSRLLRLVSVQHEPSVNLRPGSEESARKRKRASGRVYEKEREQERRGKDRE